MNFFEQFKQYKLNRDDIFSYVERWHKDPEQKSVEDFLGLTTEQYHLFLMEPTKVEHLRSKEYDNIMKLTFKDGLKFQLGMYVGKLLISLVVLGVVFLALLVITLLQ